MGDFIPSTVTVQRTADDIKERTDNLPDDLATEATAQKAADHAKLGEGHFHNYERVLGAAAVPTATHFADVDSLTPFVVTAGNVVFGTEVQVLGSDDTPIQAGKTSFDPRKWSIVDVSNANPYIMRVIWGTPTQSVSDAEAADQYSETTVHQLTANGQNKPQDCFFPRIASGSQLWVKAKAGGASRTISFLHIIHEYPAPEPV